MRPPHASAWTWAPPLALAALLAALAIGGTNHALFLFLNHLGGWMPAPFWTNLTMLGDGAVVLVTALPCIRRRPQCFWAVLLAALLVGLLVQGAKQMIDVPRPLAVFAPGAFLHTGPALRAVSFPSGHAAAIAALAAIWNAALPGRPGMRAALLALACLVGLSRVMVGVHWPLDVLAGWLAGWLAGLACLRLAATRGWGTANPGGRLAGAVLMALAAALLVSHHVGYADVLPMQRLLAAVCLVWGGHEWLLLWRKPRFALRME